MTIKQHNYKCDAIVRKVLSMKTNMKTGGTNLRKKFNSDAKLDKRKST